MLKWKLYIDIFISFLRIGPLTFGGGYAMIPLIEREVVTKRKWVKPQDIADVLSIAESVPGAIAINSATIIGFRIAGVTGAIAAMTGVILPTFIIVIILCISFLTVQDNEQISAAFEGIRAAIVALIAYAGYKIGKTAVYDKTTCITAVITCLLLLFFHIHPVFIILTGICFGILIVKIKDKFGVPTRLEKDE